jgi:hypothetical protein
MGTIFKTGSREMKNQPSQKKKIRSLRKDCQAKRAIRNIAVSERRTCLSKMD